MVASGTVMEEQLDRRRRESADTVQVPAWLVYIQALMQKPRPPELSFSLHLISFCFHSPKMTQPKYFWNLL